ncbi:hypothetical protein BV22DRAFT_1043797 [Leucogyrophana mollusca]|uniref:Uncharacterized protein n=1 Tax=Leucogyrophana mollusca TaxID=85980 RepID=A0ACB8BVV9_9AGAM|nr:hypothetical protein BV22DRAFT_1043797 [Leucogyrophana mollusca]
MEGGVVVAQGSPYKVDRRRQTLAPRPVAARVNSALHSGRAERGHWHIDIAEFFTWKWKRSLRGAAPSPTFGGTVCEYFFPACFIPRISHFLTREISKRGQAWFMTELPSDTLSPIAIRNAACGKMPTLYADVHVSCIVLENMRDDMALTRISVVRYVASVDGRLLGCLKAVRGALCALWMESSRLENIFSPANLTFDFGAGAFGMVYIVLLAGVVPAALWGLLARNENRMLARGSRDNKDEKAYGRLLDMLLPLNKRAIDNSDTFRRLLERGQTCSPAKYKVGICHSIDII